MSSVLSAPPSVVDIDRSSDPDTPSKSFIRDSSSSSTSSPPSALSKKQQGSPKSSVSNSPPRPGKSEPGSPPSQSDTTVNGHAPEPKEEHREVPSQAPTPGEASASKENDEPSSPLKDEADKDDSGLLPGSDPDDDTDLGSGESDGDWSQDDIEADIRRVKVYELIGQNWTDRGTAFCQGDYDEEARQARLIARAEHTNEILLQCIIRTNDVYQRQQDTLIVWTEPDGTDYALSFQDIEGCGEVWEFIGEVQRHLQDKGVSRLQEAIGKLAELITAFLSPKRSAEEEAGTSDSIGSSSMHTFPAGTMNPLLMGPKLPMPLLGNMQECERVIKQISRQPHGKEKLFDQLMTNDYVKRVIVVMKQAEDLEDIKELHACCSCMQAILLVNDHNLYEYILQDPIFLGVIGVLEYDPEFPTHKASYREFLETSGRFRQPIPIRDPQTRSKIHQTYRLQFLRDFILARATDDATFNVLNSCVIFNQIDIVNHIQQDERFLRELVGLFLTADKGGGGKDREVVRAEKRKAKEEKGSSGGKEIAKDESDERGKPNGGPPTNAAPQSPEIGPVPAPAPVPDPPISYTSDDRRKDTIILIQQLCLMGKNVQLPVRLQLFRTLVDRGVLHAIQWALSRTEKSMISTGGEVLGLLLDHDVIGVRQHVMRQVGVAGKPTLGVSVNVAGQAGDAASTEGIRDTLLETLCRSLTNSQELAYKSQMADAIRAVLEVDGTETNNTATMRAMARAKDDPVTERFVEYFYAKCCENLFRPMVELPEYQKITEPILRLSRERSNLYLYLCDLLTSFLLQHSFRSLFFLVSNSALTPPLVPRISSLLKAKEKHLRLAALRFFRACLKLGNRNLFLHLIKHDAIFPILELTSREVKWDNLLSSCCQEFFEHIRKENFKELLAHLMTKYEAKVKELARLPVCGERFQNLIRRWEMNTEPPPKQTKKTQIVTPTMKKWMEVGRPMEAEEEDYFNNSDEEETPRRNIWAPIASLSSVNLLKRKRGKGFTAISAGPPPKHARPTTTTAISKSRQPPTTQSLVDYEEDDDMEESGAASSSSSLKISSEPATGGQFSPLSSSPSRKIDWFSETLASDDNSLPLKSSHNASSSSSSGGGGSHIVDDDPLALRLLRADSPPRLGEKRRRSEQDDDEDEMLEKLVKYKKPSLEKEASKSSSSSSSGLLPSSSGLPKSAGSGKMKLKLGVPSFSLVASKGPLETEKKDVDSG